jgi:hypothetical protein
MIVATGYADPAMIDRAFRDGAYDYLEKVPTLPALLRVKVRNAAEAIRERRLAALSAEEREKEIRDLWTAVRTETDNNRKGKLLEDLMVLLFKTVHGFTHVETRRKRMGPNDLDELVTSKDRNEVLKKLHARSVMSGNGH